MANIKSQKKRIKTNESSRLANKSFRSKVKTITKKALIAKKENNENKDQLLNKAISLIDMAVSKGVYKPNKAGREKSRLMSK